MSETRPCPYFSVILPCFNEVDNIEPLVAELVSVLEPLGRPFEIIYVDDCSNDGSYEKLVSLLGTHGFLRVIRHKKNLGESAALASGYRVARGQVFITMDADLQNPPADIPVMFAKLEEGFDAVCGVRAQRQDSFSKRMSSKVANGVRGFLLGDGVLDAGCTYRMMKQHCVLELPVFRATHRFTTTMLIWNGFRVHQMIISHRPRTMGYSKYGIGNRLWVGILDMIGMRWFKGRMVPSDRLETEPRPPSES
jgi:glycosyltransferase involved in cell wall biosynthesis